MFLNVKQAKVPNTAYNFWSYQFPNKEYDVYGATITSAYPESGSAINYEVDTLFFILDGEAMFQIDGKNHIASKGDVCFITRKTPFSITPYHCEELKIWLINNPPFEYKQHEKYD